MAAASAQVCIVIQRLDNHIHMMVYYKVSTLKKTKQNMASLERIIMVIIKVIIKPMIMKSKTN